jgi:hypothetical protein
LQRGDRIERRVVEGEQDFVAGVLDAADAGGAERASAVVGDEVRAGEGGGGGGGEGRRGGGEQARIQGGSHGHLPHSQTCSPARAAASMAGAFAAVGAMSSAIGLDAGAVTGN